jgi:hypothetical protein
MSEKSRLPYKVRIRRHMADRIMVLYKDPFLPIREIILRRVHVGCDVSARYTRKKPQKGRMGNNVCVVFEVSGPYGTYPFFNHCGRRHHSVQLSRCATDKINIFHTGCHCNTRCWVNC